MRKRLLYVVFGILVCGIAVAATKVFLVLNHIPTHDEISAEIGIRIPATATELHYNKQLAFTKIVCVRFRVPADSFKLLVEENHAVATGSSTTSGECGNVASEMKRYCEAGWWEPEQFANGDCYKRERIPISPEWRKSTCLVSDGVRSSEPDSASGRITVHILCFIERGVN
jgi:hypothetical protein